MKHHLVFLTTVVALCSFAEVVVLGLPHHHKEEDVVLETATPHFRDEFLDHRNQVRLRWSYTDEEITFELESPAEGHSWLVGVGLRLGTRTSCRSIHAPRSRKCSAFWYEMRADAMSGKFYLTVV